ncbi:hypothetical protein [Seonamhaeicola aphaedonensis]|uniref:Uncharacterized protein n=1 Tax=Seonamhaeicola aphaedonensis TaxID=1461338 RepID=A0A3D9H458_9FLAO|nr:hypothetical protein [Seonamhaeicola aphaedonensis]RED43716.1 hypothetical protein DFQ02_1322 [Seonamhaeicola aphaedonensis]
MAKFQQIIIFFVLLSTFSCNKKYLKYDALRQSHQCLSIKQEIGELTNDRSPYFFKMEENFQDDVEFEAAVIDSIKSISEKIMQKHKDWRVLIHDLKKGHKDSRFFDATLIFLDRERELEMITDSLFKSIINPNSDKAKEKELSQVLLNLVAELEVEKKIYEKKESDFHNENGIKQSEVDSIVHLIKNKKTIANKV